MSEQYSVPTENEILKWLNDCADATRNGEADHYWAFDVQTDDACDIVRAALEKWGKQQDIVPIPLSEGERKPNVQATVSRNFAAVPILGDPLEDLDLPISVPPVM